MEEILVCEKCGRVSSDIPRYCYYCHSYDFVPISRVLFGNDIQQNAVQVLVNQVEDLRQMVVDLRDELHDFRLGEMGEDL